MKEGWEAGNEKDFMQITKETNFTLRQAGFPSPITPKLVGSYVRKFLKLDTERRGHDNKRFPVLTPGIAKEVF